MITSPTRHFLCLVILLCSTLALSESSNNRIVKRFAVDSNAPASDSSFDSDDEAEQFDNEVEKRAANRYEDFLDYAALKRFSSPYRNDLGKRAAFRYDLGKRQYDPNADQRQYYSLFDGDFEPMHDLEEMKRFGGNSGFRSDLGKRAEYINPEESESFYDGLPNMQDLDEKRAAFRSDLGKRLFRNDLGKRQYFRADLGKRASYRMDLGKRYAPSFRNDLGKRPYFRADLGKRAAFRSDLGKRAGFRADLGKRSTDAVETMEKEP